MTHSPFSPKGRAQALDAMENQEVDILIIGGGITGCGLARDAALRGLKVALVEKADFGYGTSSRSSKLVHGGVRYLENGDLKMVKESARERKVLRTIAPHLVHPLPFVFPLYKGDSALKYRFGFSLFDTLAKSSKADSHKILTPKEIRKYAPKLRDPLKSGIVYREYITEDARLTVMNALSAAEHGAFVANYAAVTKIRTNHHDRVVGATVQDILTKQAFTVTAKITINATGPWAEETLKDNHFDVPKQLLLSKGIHLIFSATKIPLTGAVALKSADGKEGFAIRRWNYVYIGTTDVPHQGAINEPIADEEAINHLLSMTQNCFPELNVTEMDILGTWAGLRPLILEKGKSARDTSRKDAIWTIKKGLLTIAGGKLTTYRKMADRVLKEVAKQLQKNVGDHHLTSKIPLPGGDIGPDYTTFKKEMMKTLDDHGIPEVTAERLTWLYGSFINYLLEYGKESPFWLEPLAPDIPALKGEVKLAVEMEMAHHLIDFMDRRAALLFFGKNHGRNAAETAAAIMGQLLGWNNEEIQRQVQSYLDYIGNFSFELNVSK